MNLKLNSKEILKASQSAGALIRQQNTMPILDNLLFKSENGKLSVTADNLEIRATVEMDVAVNEDVSLCVNYDLLTKVLKGLPDTAIEMEIDGNTLKVVYPNGQYDLPIFGSQEFPIKTAEPEESGLSVNALDFAEALKKAAYFIDEKNINTALASVLLNISKDSIKVVGGNGGAIFESSIDCKSEIETRVMISKPSMSYLTASMTEDLDVEIKVSDNNIFLQIGDRKISAILVNASYPSYETLFDTNATDKIYHVEKDSFLPALKRMINLTDKHVTAVAMTFEKSTLVMNFENIDQAFSAKETMPVEYDGDDFKIGFNAHFINHAISNSDEKITMGFSQNDRPCIVTGENSRCIVGPVKIK